VRSAARRLHISLRRQRRVPGQNLEPVQPAVFDHKEPSAVSYGIHPTHRAWQALPDWRVHSCPSSTGCYAFAAAARVGRLRFPPLLRGTVSIPRFGSKRNVKWAAQVSQSQKCSRLRIFLRLPSKAVFRSEGHVSARNNFPSRKDRNGTVHVGLAHFCSMNFESSLSRLLAREISYSLHSIGQSRRC